MVVICIGAWRAYVPACEHLYTGPGGFCDCENVSSHQAGLTFWFLETEHTVKDIQGSEVVFLTAHAMTCRCVSTSKRVKKCWAAANQNFGMGRALCSPDTPWCASSARGYDAGQKIALTTDHAYI